ncbi:MAG: LapA family protein [Gallionella sp.]|nr:LapA family protein [Gallionella sp.]MDD4960263.1 LapA family protein [Gallionella sp.]
MRYLNWLWRLFVFFMLIGFTVKNDQPVTLRYFLGFEWESSLVIVLFTFFAAGAAVAVLAMLNIVLTQRRNIARLEREVRVKNKLAELDDTPTLPTLLS